MQESKLIYQPFTLRQSLAWRFKAPIDIQKNIFFMFATWNLRPKEFTKQQMDQLLSLPDAIIPPFRPLTEHYAATPILNLAMANEAVSLVYTLLTHALKSGKNLAEILAKRDFEEKTLLILAAKMGPVGDPIIHFIFDYVEQCGGDALLRKQDLREHCVFDYLCMYGSQTLARSDVLNAMNRIAPKATSHLDEDFNHMFLLAALQMQIDPDRSADATGNFLNTISTDGKKIEAIQDRYGNRIHMHPSSLSKIEEDDPSYELINKGCGSLSPETFKEQVLENRKKSRKQLEKRTKKEEKQSKYTGRETPVVAAKPDKKKKAKLSETSITFHRSPDIKLKKEGAQHLQDLNYADAAICFQKLLDYLKRQVSPNTKFLVDAHCGLADALYQQAKEDNNNVKLLREAYSQLISANQCNARDHTSHSREKIAEILRQVKLALYEANPEEYKTYAPLDKPKNICEQVGDKITTMCIVL